MSSTASRTYAVQANGSGQAVVNVPWTNTTYTLPTSFALTKAVDGAAGTLGVLTSDSTATNAVKYKTLTAGSNITLTGAADKITIAASNTTYANATNSAAGLVKLNQAAADATINTASTTSGKYYPVNLTTGGVAYVNVPWTDAQTTITGNAGTATTLATARTVQTNLASTSSASFNGSTNITPGVTGVLPLGNGGTGSSTKNFVDLSTNQTVAGTKTFTGTIIVPTPALP